MSKGEAPKIIYNKSENEYSTFATTGTEYFNTI